MGKPNWSNFMIDSRDRLFQVGEQLHAQGGELCVGADLGHEAAQAQAVAGFAGFLRRHLENENVGMGTNDSRGAKAGAV